MSQFCFIGKGDEQLSKRLGVIFSPAVSSSGSVTGASPERHVGESHPAPFLCRPPWRLSLGLWLWAGGFEATVFLGGEGPGRGELVELCVSAEEHSAPGLCLLIMDWICLLIRVTILGLLLESDVVWVADVGCDDHSGDDHRQEPCSITGVQLSACMVTLLLRQLLSALLAQTRVNETLGFSHSPRVLQLITG